MTSALRHRGPDDAGTWLDAASGVALGHRRLSIIDLSPEGHQPMRSRSGRYTIAYNGEVYNFGELRAELEAAGDVFRGHSDTEVMLACIERWGLLPAVRKFAGMFAFALFDQEERTLHLARDRIGEKPLYYRTSSAAVLFGSELKALRAYPGWKGVIDRGALTLLLRFGYIPAPYTIYAGVHKVLPGSIVSVRATASPTTTTYWSAAEVVNAGLEDPVHGSDAEVLDELDALLRATVRREMVSDVPLGAFLSGGVDSSLVVALMQAQSDRPIRTFTIGFREQEYNEAQHAAAVARHLGTEHTELYVTPAEAQAVVPRLPTMYDEPFGDSSQVPTFLVSALARQHVTVALSGDGGDELFGGYDRYAHAVRIWRGLRLVPPLVRRSVGRAILAVPPARWNRWLKGMGPVLSQRAGVRLTGDRLHKLARMLSGGDSSSMYLDLVAHWPEARSVVRDSTELVTLHAGKNGHTRRPLLAHMMALDLVTYLPDDIMVKVDRASMAVSLESRAPFLDHRVVEFAWRLPPRFRIREREGKWPLRRLLDRYVSPDLTRRPKMGFGVPLDHWLRGPLRHWAEALLDPHRLRRDGFFESDVIARTWAEHQSGIRNWQYQLWDVLMFQAWLAD